jgi:hypothetical protein
MNRRIAGIVAALLLVPGMWALSGCGQAAEEAIEQGIEQGTGGDVEIDDDGVKVTDEEGNEFAAGSQAELPSTWPEVVPTPDGTLVFAGGSAADGSSGAVSQGIWQADSSVADTADAYATTLAGAGFTVDPSMSMDDGAAKIANYNGNGYLVGVIVAEGDGGKGATISVTVSPQS